LKRLEDFIDKRIIKAARAKGYLTFQDVISAFPDRIPSPQEMDQVFSFLEKSNLELRLSEKGKPTISDKIELQKLFDLETDKEEDSGIIGENTSSEVMPDLYSVLEDEEPDIDTEEIDDAEIEEIIEDEDDGYDIDTCSERGSGIGDSAIQYLREMGKVSLLTREEEVDLSKQIEESQEIIRETILEIPFAIAEIRKLCNKAFERALGRLAHEHNSDDEVLVVIQRSNRLSALEKVVEFLKEAEVDMRSGQESLRSEFTEESIFLDSIQLKKQEVMRAIAKIRLSQDDVWKVVCTIKGLCDEACTLREKIRDVIAFGELNKAFANMTNTDAKDDDQFGDSYIKDVIQKSLL
jgi:RNA polymerase primary sigma factor